MLVIRFSDRTELFGSLCDAIDRAERVRKNVETKMGRVKYRYQPKIRKSGGRHMVNRVQLVQR